MPKRDGYEVAAYVKSRPKLAHIPVVLLTGAFEPIDQARAAAAGSSDVLAKPFEPQMVINRVKELLGRKRPEDDGAYAPAEAERSQEPQPQMGNPQPASRTAGIGDRQGPRPCRSMIISISWMRRSRICNPPRSRRDGSDEIDWPAIEPVTAARRPAARADRHSAVAKPASGCARLRGGPGRREQPVRTNRTGCPDSTGCASRACDAVVAVRPVAPAAPVAAARHWRRSYDRARCTHRTCRPRRTCSSRLRRSQSYPSHLSRRAHLSHPSHPLPPLHLSSPSHRPRRRRPPIRSRTCPQQKPRLPRGRPRRSSQTM